MSNEHENAWAAAAAANNARLDDTETPAASRSEARRGRFHSTAPGRAGETPSTNPLLPPSPSTPDEDELEGEYGPVMATGPAEPTGAPEPVNPLLPLPERFDRSRAWPGLEVQVVGLHGGAGTSTVTSLLGREAIDCHVGLGRLVDPDLPVVLVARTHARGLALVKRAAEQWASGGFEHAIRLLGVVLVDDAPTLSKSLHREMKSVERALPHSWRLGWNDDFRHDADLPGEALKGRLRRVRRSLLTQAQKLPRSTAAGDTTATKGTA